MKNACAGCGSPIIYRSIATDKSSLTFLGCSSPAEDCDWSIQRSLPNHTMMETLSVESQHRIHDLYLMGETIYEVVET